MRIGLMAVAVGFIPLSACAPPIMGNSGAFAAGSALRTPDFVMAGDASESDPSLLQAREAVRRELAGHGLRESADAAYRVDVGLATAPLPLEVSAGRGVVSAGASTGIALCRRRQYVLSVAMIDRNDGRIVFRTGATARRCAKAATKTIPQLARSALGR